MKNRRFVVFGFRRALRVLSVVGDHHIAEVLSIISFGSAFKRKRNPGHTSRRGMALALQFFMIITCFTSVLGHSLSWAQNPGTMEPPGQLPVLTGPQKRTLSLIAREAIDATIEGRPSRQATVDSRLMVPQALVVSIYIDGQLRARAWRLTELQPLYLGARDLTYQALSTPKVSRRRIQQDELHKARVSLAVLSHFTLAKDEKEIPPRSAVVIYNGFTEWLGLPGDVTSGSAKDLLIYICTQAGLRPMAWLLPQTTIYSAEVEGTTESDF